MSAISLSSPEHVPDGCKKFHQTPPFDNFERSNATGLIRKRRIRINVRGFQFETFQTTLEQYPETMLGCPTRRVEFYDPVRDQYFLDRDPEIFHFILFFYQSNGILSRPETISKDNFDEELKFYGITTDQEEADKRSFGAVNEAVAAPEEHQRLKMQIQRDQNLNCSQREKNMRTRCWLMLEYPRVSLAGMIWGRISISIILLSVFAFCLETVPELNCPEDKIRNTHREWNQSAGNKTQTTINNASHQLQMTAINETSMIYLQDCSAARIWFIVETSIVLFFMAEYTIRIYTAPRRCNFVTSLFGIVDVVAIVPYFITLAVYGWRTEMNLQVTSFSVLRIIRLCRVLRVFKLSRYSNGLQLVGKTFTETWRTLSSLMMCVLMGVILSSSFLFYFEEQDAVSSIVKNFYWAIITMTTVGYGDEVPRTLLGKLTASCCMVFGIVLLLILPLPVFVTHFSSLYQKEAEKKRQNKSKGAYATPTLIEKLRTKQV